MKNKLDIYVATLLSIIYMFIVYIFLNNKYQFIVILSFWGVIFINFFLMLIAFKSKYSFFEAIISIFYVLFFILAPVLQLAQGYYPTPFPVNNDYILYSNLCNIIFLGAYLFFRKTTIRKKKFRDRNQYPPFIMSRFTIITMNVLFFVFFIPKFPSILQNIIYRIPIESESQIFSLIFSKFITYIPLLFVFYYIMQYKNTANKKYLRYLIAWMTILIICKNPFNTKRNSLGPIYLSITMFYFLKKYNVRNFLIVTNIVFIVGFPLSAVITHSNIGLSVLCQNFNQYFNSEMIIEQFYQLHFDAFSNLNVAIEYTKIYGYSLGIQLLAAFLFFIPRSLWITKPVGSGEMTGMYLIQNYGYWFDNLSCPITAEAYLNGGLIGVIIFAFLLSEWSKIVYRWIIRNDYYTLMAWYMIIHLFFLLRGDLMNGIAFLIGPLTAVYFLPVLLEKVRKCIC